MRLYRGTTGAIGGFGIGTGLSLLQGNNIGDAVQAGGQNALFGLGAGLISGTVQGLKESRALGVNPLAGRPKSYDLKPLTGRVEVRMEPQSLEEQLTLKEAQSGQGTEIMRNRINDPQYQGWMKMQNVHQLPNGGKIIIHYWYNPLTGETTGFKFKNFPLSSPSINIFPLNLK